MSENILDLAIMLRGSSERFVDALVSDEVPTEELIKRWNHLDTVMLELRRSVAKAAAD